MQLCYIRNDLSDSSLNVIVHNVAVFVSDTSEIISLIPVVLNICVITF